MITSFRIEWDNRGEIHAVYDVAKEITKVSRRKKQLTTAQLNSIGNTFISSEVALNASDVETLFQLVEEIVAEADGHNYMEPVNDGWHWRLLLRHSDKSVLIIEGTVAAPPSARALEYAISDPLHKNLYLGKVHLFGAC